MTLDVFICKFKSKGVNPIEGNLKLTTCTEVCTGYQNISQQQQC